MSDNYESCVICLESLSNGKHVVLSECGHEYHEECLKEWVMEGKHSCPLCRGQ